MLAYVEQHRAFFAIANEHGLFAGAASPQEREPRRSNLHQMETFRSVFRAIVEEGVASGDLEPLDADALARFLGGTMRAFVLSSLVSRWNGRARPGPDDRRPVPARRRKAPKESEVMAASRDQGRHATRSYYDEFSHRYEAERRPHRPDGYHALVDDLEVEIARGTARRRRARVRRGTGLLLERIARFARSAKGIDLSPGECSTRRALAVSTSAKRASLSIPFPDESFDVDVRVQGARPRAGDRPCARRDGSRHAVRGASSSPSSTTP